MTPPIEVLDIRILSRDDLVVLQEKRTGQQLQTIRDSHHRVARAMALGLSNGEVAAACGCSISRVTMLRHDPALMELVAHYRAILTVETIDLKDTVNEYLESIRTKSLAMIEDKIDTAVEAGEFLPSRDLATFAELGLDRTGYGKVNKNVNINVGLANNIEKAIARSTKVREVRTIEATPTRPQSVPGALSPKPRSPVPSQPIAASFRRL